MKFCITILKEEEKLEDLLRELKKNEIYNITTINSTSMVSDYKVKNIRKMHSVIGTFKHLNSFYHDDSLVVLTIIQDNQLAVLKDILNKKISKNDFTFISFKIEDFDGEL